MISNQILSLSSHPLLFFRAISLIFIRLKFSMRLCNQIIILFLAALFVAPVQGQKSGLQSINAHDLKVHMEFLASDELEGRNTGEPGLMVAARYLAVQAQRLGLKPADPEHGYFQHYTILEKSYDLEKSRITIYQGDSAGQVNHDPFFVFPAVDADSVTIEGEVVFAGYGIRNENFNYNDFENIDITDKVVLIMNRAPMNEDGTEAWFDSEKWTGTMSMRYKLPYIYSRDPRAVLLVYDPKSGLNSIEDASPGIMDLLANSRSLKSPDETIGMSWNRPKTVLIHRSVADQLLEGTGGSLEELQLEIDRELSPQSFVLENKRIRIDLNMKMNEMVVPNVFGLIEGSDPVLKEEVVIYMAHYDHVGTDGEGGVYNGADDNASGTVALIELAEAFMKEKKRPARSIGILWVSAEEIGLYGSEYFADHPLVPTEKTAAVINLDMVGRRKTAEDANFTGDDLTIMGGDTVKVIGGLQSSVLMQINKETLEEMGLVGNYTYNQIYHPEQYFYRSDHINFARKDIPVLFYSTGTHRDYHTLSDVEERIDYDKFLKMTRFCYKVGFNVARYRDSIKVDNPMSGW